MFRLVLVLAGVTGVVGIAAAPAAAVDLTVTGVEVTQATQKPDNSIKLVALRSTAVRATTGGGSSDWSWFRIADSNSRSS